MTSTAKPAAGYSPSNIGIANLPNQLHRIVSRQGTNFTLMVVGTSQLVHESGCSSEGESGLGKTTFVNTLFTTAVLEPKDMQRRYLEHSNESTVSIEITKAGAHKLL